MVIPTHSRPVSEHTYQQLTRICVHSSWPSWLGIKQQEIEIPKYMLSTSYSPSTISPLTKVQHITNISKVSLNQQTHKNKDKSCIKDQQLNQYNNKSKGSSFSGFITVFCLKVRHLVMLLAHVSGQVGTEREGPAAHRTCVSMPRRWWRSLGFLAPGCLGDLALGSGYHGDNRQDWDFEGHCCG